MSRPPYADDLWVWKPANSNNGKGVEVLTGREVAARTKEMASSRENNPVGLICVQRYIRSPLLIDGLKFDIRVYVLLTSLDPLVVYVYDDGLVRMATERYSENPRSLKESCIHVTNFDVNRRNGIKFVHSETPNDYRGHKVILTLSQNCVWF